VARRGPARPGQDPTLETAVAVVACLIIGVVLWASKPLEVNGKQVSAAQYMRDTAGKAPTPARPPEKTPDRPGKPPEASPGGGTPEPTPEAPPTQVALPKPTVFQIAIPFENEAFADYASETRKLFEQTVRAAQAGNVVLATKGRKQIREGNDLLQDAYANLQTLKFRHPAWRGAHKKVAMAVAMMASGADLVHRGKEDDDDVTGEAMEAQGRKKLQAGMRRLQKVVDYMEILRKKGATSKA